MLTLAVAIFALGGGLFASLSAMEGRIRDDMRSMEIGIRDDMGTMEIRVREDMGTMEGRIREDMAAMEDRIRKELQTTREDMQSMESGIREDMQSMESGIREDMGTMEGRIRQEMEAMEGRIRKELQTTREEMQLMESGIPRRHGGDGAPSPRRSTGAPRRCRNPARTGVAPGGTVRRGVSPPLHNRAVTGDGSGGSASARALVDSASLHDEGDALALAGEDADFRRPALRRLRATPRRRRRESARDERACSCLLLPIAVDALPPDPRTRQLSTAGRRPAESSGDTRRRRRIGATRGTSYSGGGT